MSAEPLPAAATPLAAVWLPRGKRWLGILSAYFGTQTLVQLAGIGAGLLFIRFLPVREFALYALAFSVVTFFNFLTDLGSTNSLLHFFREAAAKGEDFGRYYAAVLSLRRAGFLIGATAVLAVFPAVAAAKGFTLARSLPVTLAIVLCVWFQINSALRILALRLADRYGRSYRAELAGGAARLLLALVIVAAALRWAWLGVLSAAAATALTAWLARPRPDAAGLAAPLPPGPPSGLRPYRRQVVRYLLPNLPSALYFSIQGPLVIWISATFGTTRTIAEVGALGRLGLAVGLFSSLTGAVFLPRLARLTDERLYRVRYLQCGAFLLLVVAAFLGAAALLPGAFLLVLGPSYRGLHRELLLIVLSSGLGLLDTYALGVNAARSWNRWQTTALGGLVVVQVLAIACLPLRSTWHVLLFNVLTAACGFVSQVTMNWIGFLRPGWVRWA
jgi:O-antigen/teichoic acid export membrane protein